MIKEAFLYRALDAEAMGKLLKLKLRLKKISARDVARALSISTQTVYKWTSGSTIPSLENMVQLSAILEEPIESLIVYEEIAPTGIPEN